MAKKPGINKKDKIPKSKVPKKPVKKSVNTNKRRKESKPEITTVQALQKLSFYASIAATNQRQSATTLDNSYSIQFKTHDFNVLDLGKVPPLTLVRVTVEIISESDRVKADKEKDKYYE